MERLSTFLFIMFIFFIANCKSNGKKETTIEKTKTKTISNVVDRNIDISTIKKDKIELKYLPSIVNNQDKSFQDKFYTYLNKLNSRMKSEEDIIELMDMRDSLLGDFQSVIENYYYDKGESDYKLWEKVEKECDTIGFHSIYAEGMFVGFGVCPIITQEVDLLASDELKNYLKFNYAYSYSLGGEYPYASITGYYLALIAGEKIITKYRNTKYFDKIFDDYMFCLNVCTDIHSADGDQCFYGGFSNEFYPFMSTCSEWPTLLKEHPKSLFAPIIKKLEFNHSDISENTSTDSTSKNTSDANIYAVIIDKVSDNKEADKLLFDYMVKGIDVVHKLSLKKDNKIDYYTCYRFYSNEKLAKEAYQTIIETIPKCKIYKIRNNTKDYYPDGIIVGEVKM